jgi:hypothetical protein
MVILPIELLELDSLVNHIAPSGPAVIANGDATLGSVNFATTATVVVIPLIVVTMAMMIRPIELLPKLVNQIAPSGPVAIPVGDEMLFKGSVKFVTTPLVVIRPTGVVVLVGEPQGAVWAGRYADRSRDAGSGEVRDDAVGGDPPDGVVVLVGEPQGAIGPGHDRRRPRETRASKGRDDAVGSDTPDGVVELVGEPQGAVGPGRDRDWVRDTGVDGDLPCRRSGLSGTEAHGDRQAQEQSAHSNQQTRPASPVPQIHCSDPPSGCESLRHKTIDVKLGLRGADYVVLPPALRMVRLVSKTLA